MAPAIQTYGLLMPTSMKDGTLMTGKRALSHLIIATDSQDQLPVPAELEKFRLKES